MTMPQEKKRVLLIGEQLDVELLAILGGEGYEIAALESPHRARDVFPLYKPHFIIVHLRYPKDVVYWRNVWPWPGQSCRCCYFPPREAAPR